MILDKIIKHKKQEIRYCKKYLPLSRFKSKLKKSNRSFTKAITSKEISLIAEIKAASPSKGIIVKRFDPVKIAKKYEKAGASAISVLTDTRFFAGCLDFICMVRKKTKVPILRKDFIIDEYQVYESRYCDADAILLIAGILSGKQLAKFIKLADKYNMDCLVEVHNPKELEKALKANAKIIGINNRNLKNLKINLDNTSKLVRLMPPDMITVSESGFSKKSDIKKVKGLVNAVLIGTTLMQSKDPKKKIKELMK
jgi:indole-3-glycerol phosphate synthase